MVREIITASLLVISAFFALVSALGIARSENNFAALHALGVAGVAVPVLVLIAIPVDVGFGVSLAKGTVLAVLLIVGSPVASHAIAVAQRRRRRS
jgi:multicomponent Na+:H+ antiporter subunit G